MTIYSSNQAIDILKSGAKGAEVYAWPPDFERETTFAFVVIYPGIKNKGLFRKRNGGWWVTLYHKVAVDPDKTYFDCIDELEFTGPVLPIGGTTRSEFPTAEQAVDFAISYYSISEFMDYETITQKYKNLYLKN